MATAYSSSYDKTLPFTELSVPMYLNATDVTTYTVPGTAPTKYICTFGCPSNVAIYVGYNVTPSLPTYSSSVTEQPQVEFIVPGMQRGVKGGDVLSFLTGDTNDYLGISLRAIPSSM